MGYENQIVRVAKAIIHREIGIVEGARQIVRLRAELRLDDDVELDLFRAIDSQTDHLLINVEGIPLSDNRKMQNQNEIEEYGDFYETDVFRLCNEIIRGDIGPNK